MPHKIANHFPGMNLAYLRVSQSEVANNTYTDPPEGVDVFNFMGLTYPPANSSSQLQFRTVLFTDAYLL